jgi:hypothetical protein
VIKAEVTKYERQSLGRFLAVFEKDLVVKYSKSRDENALHHVKFVCEPTILLQTWVDGFNMSFYDT